MNDFFETYGSTVPQFCCLMKYKLCLIFYCVLRFIIPVMQNGIIDEDAIVDS